MHSSPKAHPTELDVVPPLKPNGRTLSESSKSDPAALSRPANSRQVLAEVWRSLGWVDRLLPLFVFLSMVLGVLIGEFAPHAQVVLSRGNLHGVSAPLVVGMLVMMWPILSAAEFERLPSMLRQRFLWTQIGISLILNWVIGPLLMLGLAEATLPDLPHYRAGVILVGVARCIAMVMIWCSLSRGDTNFCALLVIVNGTLQMVLFAPLSFLFINVFDNLGSEGISLKYSDTSIAVAVYLGIPLAAGIVTRFSMIALIGRERFVQRFLPSFGHLSLIGLLYTVICIFAQQASDIIHNIGLVFRTMVPLALYFCIQFFGTFTVLYFVSRRMVAKNVRAGKVAHGWTYSYVSVQAFTAASNNFELAIAIANSVWGPRAAQTVATTIGTLVEVPVLLMLSFAAMFLRSRLDWLDAQPRLKPRPLMTPSSTLPDDLFVSERVNQSEQAALDVPSLPWSSGVADRDIELVPTQAKP